MVLFVPLRFRFFFLTDCLWSWCCHRYNRSRWWWWWWRWWLWLWLWLWWWWWWWWWWSWWWYLLAILWLSEDRMSRCEFSTCFACWCCHPELLSVVLSCPSFSKALYSFHLFHFIYLFLFFFWGGGFLCLYWKRFAPWCAPRIVHAFSHVSSDACLGERHNNHEQQRVIEERKTNEYQTDMQHSAIKNHHKLKSQIVACNRRFASFSRLSPRCNGHNQNHAPGGLPRELGLLKLFCCHLGVPKPGWFKPGCLLFLRRSALLCSFAPFCALLRSLADLHLRSFAFICAPLCAFACFCARPRLERPVSGTAE